MTITLASAVGLIGPGYRAAFSTTVGPLQTDDMFYAQIYVPPSGNFFCAGSRYTNAITTGFLTFGIHDSPVGYQGALDVPHAPGAAINIAAYVMHADGITVVDGPAVFTGFTWDPTGGVYQLVADRARNSGVLARILAAVYRPFPLN